MQDSLLENAMLVEELDGLINLLETNPPADPYSKMAERQERKIQRAMAAYFQSLMQAIPMSEIETIYYNEVARRRTEIARKG